VEPPPAFRVTVCKAQTSVLLAMAKMVGSGLTTRVAVFVSKQFAFHFVMAYVVVLAGLTEIELVVAPVVQL
jgi:hypothetical protein